jgi:hypothetical protein
MLYALISSVTCVSGTFSLATELGFIISSNCVQIGGGRLNQEANTQYSGTHQFVRIKAALRK